MNTVIRTQTDLDHVAALGLATLYPRRLKILIGSASCGLAAGARAVEETALETVKRLGLDAVPLLCCREIPVPGSMPRVIRVMLHFYAEAGHEPVHAYIGEAQKLRNDLHAAQ